MPTFRALAVVAAWSFGFSTAAPGAETVAWQTDLDAARAETQASGKPLLLFVTSSHCPYCVKMKNETLRNPAVVAELNSHFVPVQIDRSSHPQLVKQLAVQMYPTVVVVDDTDVELRRFRGYSTAAMLVPGLKKIEAERLAARPRPGTTTK